MIFNFFLLNLYILHLLYLIKILSSLLIIYHYFIKSGRLFVMNENTNLYN